MLPVGLVPDGRDVDALFRCQLEGAELGLCLVRETVANTEREFFNPEHDLSSAID
jgi:hypothetical protein